jgi:prepilin-type N-terminal cleavage/methylation domain
MMKTPHKGFTLVETLVAISILMISIAGPYYSVYKAVQTTYIARDKLIATALAQEGIEYVRNVRDSNYLYNVANPGAQVDWLNGLTPCTGSGVTCRVDTTKGTITPPVTCNGACVPLNISSADVYTYDPGNPSRYTRSVNITAVDTKESIVTVTVTWVNSHMTNSIVVTEHLYNWL